MKTIIILALVGLCRAGGFPITADYAISERGPDRSFSLVQKTTPAIVAAAPMIAASGRALLANDLGWAGKRMAIADPVMIAGKAVIGRADIATPLMFNDWAPKTMAFAGAPIGLTARGLTGCLDCMAPTVSTSYVSRTVHKPELAIAKPMIAVESPKALFAERALYADKLMASPFAIAGKTMVASAPMAFAEKSFVEKAFLENKLLSDKLITDKLISDKFIAEKAMFGAPLAGRAMVAAAPMDLAGKLWADKVYADKLWAGKALVENKLLEDKLITDKLIADKFIADKMLATPLAFAGKTMVAAPMAWGERAFLGDKLLTEKLITDKLVADKITERALMADMVTDKLITERALLGDKALIAPMALARSSWLGDKTLMSPFAAKTMLIKK